METHRNLNIGFCLLPSELIHYIIFQLALPDIIRLKSVNKSISSLVSDRLFVRDYNLQSSSSTWLFIYKKRWHRDSILHGFTDVSNQWFRILISDMLKSIIPPGEDLYFLTASGNFFLFALNTSQEVISVNPVTKVVKKIPPSPLGPRGTSSWRRSGMKLLSYPPGSDNFRFLFAELHQNRPMLFEYDSRTEKWHAREAREENIESLGENEYHFISAYNGVDGSIIIATKSRDHDLDRDHTPMILRPRFGRGDIEGQLAVGFNWGNLIDRLHVYGDGNMMIVRSESVNNKRIRIVKGVELWGLSSNGRQWEIKSSVPDELIEKIKKPYGAMMGCVQQRDDGIIRLVLMSNMEGSWNTIWLSYDIAKGGGEKGTWNWLPLPDCNMKGSNMSGITFSSGLTLSSS